MKTNSRRSPSNQAGFSMVEIMVGMVIGLLATLVIVQIMSAFEAQKRVTTGNADAQTNGGITLFGIERELQMAGFALMFTAIPPLPASAPNPGSPLRCQPATTTFGTTGVTSIAPVTIVDGAVSDTITIRYGDSSMGGVPTKVTAVPVGNNAIVVNNFGCKFGDTTLITDLPGNVCAFSMVTASTVPGTTVQLADITGAVPGANLACLGNWNEITYRVNAATGNLERQAPRATNTFDPTVAGIVNLQAQYGISADRNSNQVTQWVDAAGGTWAAPAPNDRNRIKAIRIAVVARNPKMEPAEVTTTCSSFNTAAPTGLCAWAGSASSPAPTIDLSTVDANWLRYRYRVFETTIPLRSVIWSRGVL